MGDVLAGTIRGAGLTDEYEKFFEETRVSHDRLNETNENLLKMWEKAESDYFDKLRTQYLRKIKDPEFIVISYFVEEKWDLFLPDTVWGAIWEFRAPFEKNVICGLPWRHTKHS